MDKVKKILAVGGWAVALLMAVYLYVTGYIAQNPMPTDAPSDSTAVVVPVQ